MTTLSEILDRDHLVYMLTLGRIGKQHHPTLPLVIYNYTNQATYAGEWTHEELVCRGLIVDHDGTVIARGPSKFFNYGQSGAPEVELDDKVWVSRKEDGSLGIGWYYDGIYGVATRGSFTSDQAIKATEMLTSSDRANIKVGSTRHNRTQIFEIVYPQNRIVLNYKGLSKNIRLGFVGNDTGLIYGRNLGVLIGEGLNFEYEMTFAEAVALPIPDNEEGYVIDVFKDGKVTGHLKLKGENYVRLHSILTHTSERTIWVYMVAELFKDYVTNPKHWGTYFKHDVDAFESAKLVDDWRGQLFDVVPDEFEKWVHSTIARLESEVARKVEEVTSHAELLRDSGLEGKELFDAVKEHPFQTELIRYIRKGDMQGLLVRAWAEVQPRGMTLPFLAEEV